MSKEDIKARLSALRNVMKSKDIDAAIIPQTDAHQSEYLADHWQLRRYLSGFTGSAGTLVVTAGEARLWTDSRYFLQAADQLEGTDITLMKDGLIETPSITRWLIDTMSKGCTVGINGLVFSIASTYEMKRELEEAGLKLDVDFDPADTVWDGRPALPQDKVFIHDDQYAGQPAAEKIKEVLANARSQGASSAFISALDEIAWILNIRSRDVACNPVATAFLYLSEDNSTIFIDSDKLTDGVLSYLQTNNVAVAPYNSAMDFLGALPENARVLVSAAQTGSLFERTLGNRAVVGKSPAAMLKAVKNDVQVNGIRNAMVRDGVAMVRSLMEIGSMVEDGKALTEMGVAEILTRHRSEQALYFDNSFDTIAGYGAHGAVVHYSATPETDAKIEKGNLLLIDSGAQYLDGTTDITRTIAIGEPSDEQRHDFTLVMKGHIAIANAIFPEGTRGTQLDVLARMFLWNEGKSYLHGTGHGVGHFLNVHEGPQSIRLNDTLAPLTPGMVTSNEPGIYVTGKYGIRCENLVLTVPAMTTGFGRFYTFETLTLCPFDLSLFEIESMTEEEIEWVDDYHQRVYDALAPHLDAEGQAWLAEHTRSLLILQ